MLDAGDRSCALEATSHGSELGRLAGTRFAALVFTNLTQDHLDLHGSMERYFDAKRRLFVEGEAPAAAVNVGDPYGRRLADELRVAGKAPLLTFALDGGGRRDAGAARATARGARFDARRHRPRDAAPRPLQRRERARHRRRRPAPRPPRRGDRAGIASVRGVPGRFEPVDEGQPFLVVVDYSHTPDSLETALRTARDLADGRVICVFGCGGDRDRGKRPLMGRARLGAAATSPSSPPTTRAARIPTRSSARCSRA